ncbi:MAG: M36 family metallopeptidase [Parafilimonas sp.]
MNLKTLRLKMVIALFVGCVAADGLSAQELTGQSAAALVRTNASSLGLSKNDLGNMRISSAYIDKTSGASLVYVQQTYKGADVFNAIQTYAFKNGKMISATGQPLQIADMANSKTGKAAITPANAVSTAAANLRLAVGGSLAAAKQINGLQQFDFGKLAFSSVNVKSKLIWLTDETTNQALLSWQVEIQPKGSADYWLVNVDALKGNVISKINLNVVCDWTHPNNNGQIGTHINTTDYSAVATTDADALIAGSAKYRVVPFPAESPNHPGGAPVVKTNPWTLAGAGNNAATLNWNSDGTTNFDSSRGNNVIAQEDHNGNNGFGQGALSSTPVPNLTFTAAPNFGTAPTTPVNLRFALTNLFYWNNIMHDVSYQYGFDEVSGNFQANNLGRGGAGNDYVFADGQDGSGTNNANFSTPSDGGNPRMQMFLFDAVPNFTVNKPTAFAGKKTAVESAFSTANKIVDKGPITGPVVLYNNDASGTTHDGCVTAFNASALVGKIALVDRGTCSFTVKALNAQNAGAKGVIVADNVPGEYPIIMGGTDNTITVPSVMISFETGDSMKQYLAAHTVVTTTMKKGVQLDGDDDAGVMCHEYTHGISNRLTGGPNNVSCLQNKEQMGEGWSDYMALMTTTNWKTATVNDGPNKRPIGTYVLGQGTDGPGIRVYPYSSDLSVNPWTYDSLKLSSKFSNSLQTYDPHIVGEVWCNMLWTMTWNIIQAKGINKNIYNAAGNKGNDIALRLMVEGLKLQKCSPGFVDGRNGILKADTVLFGGQYSAIIWQTFASRGLGYNANEGSNNNIKDGTADYSLPPGLFAETSQVQDATAKTATGIITIAPNPASTNVTLTVSGNKKALSVALVNASGQQIKTFSMNGERLDMSLPKLASGMYYVRISGEGFTETRKLVIQ